jgi:hypothetical protein
MIFSVRRLAPDGLEAWNKVFERGYEGYVPRTRPACTRAGPTRRWLKVKQRDCTVEGGGWRRRLAAR